MPSPLVDLAKAKQAVIAEWRIWAKKRGSYRIIDMQVFISHG